MPERRWRRLVGSRVGSCRGERAAARPGRLRRHWRASGLCGQAWPWAGRAAATRDRNQRCRQPQGLCPKHYHRWLRVGRPPLPDWVAQASTVPAPNPSAPCRMDGCPLWTHAGSVWCVQHWKRWRRAGRPDTDLFVDLMSEQDEFTAEGIDLRRLPTLLRLEIAYVLQCRRDEATVRLTPWQVQRIVNALVDSGLTWLLEVSEEDWADARPAPGLKKRLGALAFLRDAYRRVEALAVGQGWDVEYPRAVWRLRNLGL